MACTQPSRDVIGTRTHAAALVVGVCLFAATVGPANAEKVGVAAAVNPDAFSSLSQTPNKQLNIGKSIFYNERINTTTSGLVQVLLVDGSTFTVGPNSNLVIDKFVYDPRKKTGELVATFSKGTMRFIGGKLSKNAGGVKVKTPSGALAIRGGMFQGNANRGIYSFLYGHSLTFRGRNGQTQTVYQPGYTLDLSRGGANVRPTTAEDTNAFMAALSSPATNSSGGAGGDTGGAPNGAGGALQQANNINNAAAQEISDANFVQVQTEIQQQLIRLAKLQDNSPQDPAPTPTNTPEPDPVIKNGGTFTGFATGFLQTGKDGTGPPQFLLDGSSQITLDPEANTVSGDIELTRINRLFLPKTTTFNLGFTAAGDQAYVDDNTFLALGDDGSTRVVQDEVIGRWVRTGPRWWQRKYVLENVRTEFEDVTHTGNILSLPGQALCETCDFMKFGTWASDVSYGENVDKMGGWWIATNQPVSVSDLPTQGGARYEGSAIGTFAKRDDSAWRQGVGRGDVALDWSFERRHGDLQIKNFGTDALGRKSFSGRVYQPNGAVGFAGAFTKGGIGGGRGTFVGPRAGLAPKGVIGDFGVRGRNWKANGIYGAGLMIPR